LSAQPLRVTEGDLDGDRIGMGGCGRPKLSQGLVELTGLEEKVGELDLGVGKGGVERDDLAKEPEGFLLIAGGALG
jgi:hypothetical protein